MMSNLCLVYADIKDNGYQRLLDEMGQLHWAELLLSANKANNLGSIKGLDARGMRIFHIEDILKNKNAGSALLCIVVVVYHPA